MYNSEDICLSKGQYYLKKFKNIPLKYVLKIYFNGDCTNDIYKYAVDNLDELLDKAKTTYVPPIEEEVQEIECAKIKYMNKSVANMEMKRIQSYITNDYKPIRSYHCDNCNMWHLTSKPSSELEKFERQTNLEE